MSLLELLRSEAVGRGLLAETAVIDPATAFTLVREMPYQRATSRRPETTIREWRGTCSGKHYLLQALFAELGIRSRLIACTVELQLNLDDLPAELRAIMMNWDGRLVDVHNYLVLELDTGEMIVDATWPVATGRLGLTVNENFVLGQNQTITYPPKETWVVPEDGDPQAFKEQLLREHFTVEELACRDKFIRAVSQFLEELPEAKR
jgi:hypothetical protein